MASISSLQKGLSKIAHLSIRAALQLPFFTVFFLQPFGRLFMTQKFVKTYLYFWINAELCFTLDSALFMLINVFAPKKES